MTLSNLAEAYWIKLWFTLKAEAAKSYLSYSWWVLEPMLHVSVFYLVFGILFDRGGENFVVFLLCGQIPFLWFSRSVTNASNSIVAGRGLIQQMAIPKPFFPALVVGQDCVKQGVVFLCLFVFVSLAGFPPGFIWMALPVIILVQILLVMAFALITAAITPFVPDFRFIVNTGMTMLMFSSGIFYDYRQMVLEEHQQLFFLNPMVRLIEAYRDVLLRHVAPDWWSLAMVAVACGVAIGLLLAFFRRNDAVYARLVIE